MAAIETTGLTEQYGGMTAVDDYDRAGEKERTNNGPRDSMTDQR